MLIYNYHMTEEYIDILDNNTGEPTGERRSRAEVHKLGLWHRTVHIYVFRKFNNRLELLVHLRSKNKNLKPDKWDTRIAGHLKAGENWIEAVSGELYDEIGLKLIQPTSSTEISGKGPTV
jgi:isopentenyldiphosphate isomerase